MWKMVILHPYYSKFDFDIWIKDDLLHLLPRIEFRKSVNVLSAFQKFFDRFAHLYDGLVYVDLPYKEMKKRFQNRFENRSSTRRANRMQVYERAFKQNIFLKRVLLNQSKVPILTLSGLAQVNNNSTMIVEFIKASIYDEA